MNRTGYDERSWFTFSYSPVRDDRGIVQGMFCAVTGTTERMLLQQRQAFHLALEEELRDLADPLAVMETASRSLDRALDVARVGYGEIDDGEQHVRVERDWTDAVLNHGHLEAGMQVMTKPFDMDTLARRVRATVDME